MTTRFSVAISVACIFAAGSAFAADPLPGLKMSNALSMAPAAVPAMPAPQASAATAQRPMFAAVSPIAPPAKSGLKDYRIGPDDLLEVQVFGVDQLSRTVRVNSRGLISLPLVGIVPVGGSTAQEAEAAITARLAESYLQDPQVSLFIKEYTSQRVTIEGAVNKPGIYPLRGETSLLQSLALAGGQASLSDMSEVIVFRPDDTGRRIAHVYDVEKIRRGELEDPSLVNDDLIVVNRSKSRAAFRDSLFRDVLDTLNPFRWLLPY